MLSWSFYLTGLAFFAKFGLTNGAAPMAFGSLAFYFISKVTVTLPVPKAFPKPVGSSIFPIRV